MGGCLCSGSSEGLIYVKRAINELRIYETAAFECPAALNELRLNDFLMTDEEHHLLIVTNDHKLLQSDAQLWNLYDMTGVYKRGDSVVIRSMHGNSSPICIKNVHRIKKESVTAFWQSYCDENSEYHRRMEWIEHCRDKEIEKLGPEPTLEERLKKLFANEK